MIILQTYPLEIALFYNSAYCFFVIYSDSNRIGVITNINLETIVPRLRWLEMEDINVNPKMSGSEPTIGII